MKDKPKPKREVAIEVAIKVTRNIFFYASKDAIEDLRAFGDITEMGNPLILHVDPRFNFDEVVKYIEEYG